MGQANKYNIALLGKSGAGKSTLINAFANYIYYDTFKEALQNAPICVIPTKYYMQSAMLEEFTIQLGTPDTNESHVEGQSCTQKPKVYEFNLEDDQFNFIDVPGIGDTRGTEIDQENRKEILNVLSTFKEVHGILILLTTQDSRLTTEYQYCLTEILTMIHRDALENMFFVFTNSSGLDFRGGQSMPLLIQYLKELKDSTNIAINITNDNTFFIDNEGFRLHGLYNQYPHAVEKSDLKKNKKSWEHTREQMYRLLKCVRKVKPHSVQNTISLNEARNIGVLLLEPLASVTTIISQNTYDIDDTVDSMVRKVKKAFQEYDVDIIKLKQPRTVCTNTTCISASQITGSDRYETTYRQVCHEPCFLLGIQLKSLPEHRLRDCAAMDDGHMCKKCAAKGHRCSYELHMHIDYEQRIVPRETSLTRALKAACASIDTKSSIQKIMKQLENEQAVILECVETFMAFLKEHAIFEHNEFFEKRLDVEIRNQEVIEQNTGKNDVLKKLKAVQAKYKRDMETFKTLNTRNIKGKAISAYDVLEMRDRLFNLKFNGSKIEEIYNKTSGKVLNN